MLPYLLASFILLSCETEFCLKKNNLKKFKEERYHQPFLG